MHVRPATLGAVGIRDDQHSVDGFAVARHDEPMRLGPPSSVGRCRSPVCQVWRNRAWFVSRSASPRRWMATTHPGRARRAPTRRAGPRARVAQPEGEVDVLVVGETPDGSDPPIASTRYRRTSMHAPFVRHRSGEHRRSSSGSASTPSGTHARPPRRSRPVPGGARSGRRIRAHFADARVVEVPPRAPRGRAGHELVGVQEREQGRARAERGPSFPTPKPISRKLDDRRAPEGRGAQELTVPVGRVVVDDDQLVRLGRVPTNASSDRATHRAHSTRPSARTPGAHRSREQRATGGPAIFSRRMRRRRPPSATRKRTTSSRRMSSFQPTSRPVVRAVCGSGGVRRPSRPRTRPVRPRDYVRERPGRSVAASRPREWTGAGPVERDHRSSSESNTLTASARSPARAGDPTSSGIAQGTPDAVREGAGDR